MKTSHYNFLFPVDGCTLAYNARTNALAEVEPENLEEIRAILENPENKEKSKHFEDLVHGGFLVEDTFDELVNIRHDMYASRFNTDYLELTIAPTLDCNFRCSYCYERDVLQNKRMTDEVEEKIVELVKGQIPGIKGLHVGWYGGEPLLELKRIKSISQKLIDLCDKNKINYDAGIVTNGYLLTREALLELKQYKVGTIQITLDGMAATHDQRRYLKGKGKTFEHIIENLLSFQELYEKEKDLPCINIRINVDKNNRNEIFELLHYLGASPIAKYAAPYVAAVTDAEDREHIYTLTQTEYNKIRERFLKEAEELGYSIGYGAFYPRRILSNCCCDRVNSAVIAPDGGLYRCWEEIGNKEIEIGNVKTGVNANLPKVYYDYMMYDPIVDEECKTCKILPICMGGQCPVNRRKNLEKNCQGMWDSFERAIRNSYRIMKSN